MVQFTFSILFFLFDIPFLASPLASILQDGSDPWYQEGIGWFKLIGVIVLFLGLIIIAAYLLRKVQKKQSIKNGRHSKIQILEKKMLQPKACLYLVEVNKTQVLFAQSQTSFYPLATLPSQTEKSGVDSISSLEKISYPS